MPNAHGFHRVETTLRWQAARRLPVEPPTPEQFGWQLDLDGGQYYLPGVTDVHLERTAGLPGFVLVYHEHNDHRLYINPGLLKQMTDFILKENECTANETTIKPT